MTEEFFQELRGDNAPPHKPLAGQRGVRCLRQGTTAFFSFKDVAVVGASLLITLASVGSANPSFEANDVHVGESGALSWFSAADDDDDDDFNAALSAMDRLLDSIHEVTIPDEVEVTAGRTLLDIGSRASEPPERWAARLARQIVEDT